MSILNFFNSALDWLRNIPAAIKPKVAAALEVSTILRGILQSPVADVITALIPSTWAEPAKAELLVILNQEIPALQIEQACGADPDCWLRSIAKLPADIQDAIVFKFAAKIAAGLDGYKLPQHKYDTYVQVKVASMITDKKQV